MKNIFTTLLMLGLATPGVCAPKKANDPMTQLVDLLHKQQEELRLLRDDVKHLNQQVNELRKSSELTALAHDPALKSPEPVESQAHTSKAKEIKHEKSAEEKPIKAAKVSVNKDKPAETAPKPQEHTNKKEDKQVAKEMTTDLADHVPAEIEHQKRPELSSADAYNEARTLLEQRRFAEAEVALTQFIKKHPKDPMLINAHYWLAETHYIRSDYAQAALKFGEAYQAYLDQKNTAFKEAAMSKGPEIMFKLASSLYNIGKFEEAKLTLDELKKEFPKLPGNIQQQSDILRREIARKAKSI